nr:immunoglobulin heavy chain junction region [Macaca mulatta]MOW99220.1 immunoglobulin heavy chain junction region [Macaca mulatta]MOX01327.1 immunoglobulin heavy chain junction region [Macaca mulatta]MOX02817.1 immunoglobulin heavy chain junction region [Macaca mulatta]MOX03315.1 immunoglobulin heavy chain junction region [Macaca mulatta]
CARSHSVVIVATPLFDVW